LWGLVSRFRDVALLISAALLSACSSSSSDAYLSASLGEPLELPPDLSQQDSRSSFNLPQAFAGDDSAKRDEVPVLALVDSIQLKSSSDLYWLEVDATAADLYQLTKNFWATEGYALVVDEPVIGLMQTEWIYTEEGGERDAGSWWANLFASEDLSARQDQFRTRIERDDSNQRSRVYIVHSGTEYIHEIQIGDQNTPGASSPNEWQYRRSEPELEVEMLSRLMIYLGLQQQAVDDQVTQAKLFKPRASLQLDAEEKSPFILIKDPYQIAWNRVYNLLQRMNLEIKVKEFKSGLSGEGVFIVAVDVVKDVETGFFAFTSNTERETRRFALVLSEETHKLTRLIIEDEGGNFDTSPEGGAFITQLYEDLK
jgi:outer membrane protein assembly factor BamC